MTRRLLLCCLGLLLVAPAGVTADPIIFQSATEKPAGASGLSLFERQFIGARFFVSSPTVATSVGGHFGLNGLDAFAALVRLSSASDFPDSADLSTPDVAATALLRTPFQSDSLARGIHSAAINAELSRGWYAVVFGGGLFGSQRGGYLTTEHQQVGNPRLFSTQDGVHRPLLLVGSSFAPLLFVEGTSSPAPVPEPGAILLVSSGLGLALARRRARARATR